MRTTFEKRPLGCLALAWLAGILVEGAVGGGITPWAIGGAVLLGASLIAALLGRPGGLRGLSAALLRPQDRLPPTAEPDRPAEGGSLSVPVVRGSGTSRARGSDNPQLPDSRPQPEGRPVPAPLPSPAFEPEPEPKPKPVLEPKPAPNPAAPRVALLLLAALAAGATTSSIARARAAAAPAWPWSTDEVLLEGVLARPIETGPTFRRAIVDVDAVIQPGDATPVALRVAVFEATSAGVPLLPGDRVRVTGVARPPRGYAVEGAFDRARWLAGRGIDRLVTARPPGLVKADALPDATIWRAAGWLRARAGAALVPPTESKGAALVAALVVGERAMLAPETEDAWRRLGVSHVLSVSGLHLAAVALLLYRLARRLWLLSTRLASTVPADRAAALVAAPVAVAYAMMTGAETATLRALAAALVVLAGAFIGRRVDGWTALAVGALAILVDSPWAVYEPSFQLSFAAAASLLVTARVRLPRRWWAVPLRLLLASIGATVATAPILAVHFGELQPAGVLANLVVVPFAELVVLPLGLLAAALGGVHPSLGAPVAHLAAWLADLLTRGVELVAPHAPVVELPAPRLLTLVAAAVALVWLARRAFRPALFAALVMVWSESATTPRTGATITFLDVGQGDGAVIEVPGETWLVDAGGRLFSTGRDDPRGDPGAQSVVPFLRARRIDRLGLVVVSHPHPDHYGGLAAVAAEVTIDELWFSGDDPRDPRWEALADDLRRRGIRVRVVGTGATRSAGGVSLAVIAPDAPDPDRTVNDNSLVLRLDHAGRSVLFAGDLEATGEAALVTTPVDVVKVPHHGSRTSSTAAFVDATRPRWAVMSCGVANRFGFPDPGVVARWASAGATVLRTDQRGSVTVRITPTGAIAVTTAL